MERFKKWLKANKIEINMNCIVITFDDKEMYDAIVEMYECEGLYGVPLPSGKTIEEFKVRISPREFEVLIQVYMGSITDWN